MNQLIPGKNSLYCELHTCTHILKDGARCTGYAARTRDYCVDHAFCSIINCNQRKDNQDTSYCSQFHQCTAGACKNLRRYIPGTNSYGPYCDDHACQADAGCREARKKNSDGCAGHTCKAAGCAIPVNGNAADPAHADNFCDVHRVCQSAGCGARVHDDPVNRARARCYRHFCASGAANCGEERAVDAGAGSGAAAVVVVCAAHKCRVSGCPGAKNRLDSGAYCREHECEADACDARRHGRRKFCAEHTCRANLVPAAAGRDVACDAQGDPDRGNRCAQHVECGEGGCRNYRMTVNGIVQEKCKDHSEARCLERGCGNAALDRSDACREHVCGLSGCRFAKWAPADYCALHKCSEPGCANPRDFYHGNGDGMGPSLLLGLVGQLAAAAAAGRNSDAAAFTLANAAAATTNTLCSRHRCRVPACTYRAADDASSLYCHRHECQEDHCRNEVIKDSRFCRDHDEEEAYFSGDRGYWGRGGGGGSGGGGGGGGRGIYSGRWPTTRKVVRW